MVNSSRFLIYVLLIGLLSSCQSVPDGIITNSKSQKQDVVALNVQLGMRYLAQGNTPRAKQKLLTALKWDSNSLSAITAMAYFMEKTGEQKKAQALYQKALALKPLQGEPLNNYGTFLCRNGNFKEAESYFLKAVNDVNYVNTAGAYENAGLCALQVPDRSKAASYFKMALKHDPKRRQSIQGLLRICLQQDKLNKAQQYLKQYQAVIMSDSEMLNLAASIEAAAGNTVLAQQYQLRSNRILNLEQTGEKNEYNYNNG